MHQSEVWWADAPGNVTIPAAASGLPKDSVANVSAIVALDRRQLTECAGELPGRLLQRVLAGIDIVLER